jgi:hypothetical protein
MLQYDLDGDGRPDLAVIDCALVTERDLVYVYDGGGNMQPAERWQDAVDFSDDTLLFDIGGKGTFDLAIVFTREHDHDVAYLYDDQNGDGQVSVQRSGKRAIVDESPHWTARIESGSTWVLPDGTLNQNVHVLIDGPLMPFGYPPSYLRQLRTSGEPKWEAGIVDADGDGIPEYAYNLLLAPSPAESQLFRSGVQVNTGQTRPRQPTGYFIWPLLGGSPSYASGNYFDTPFHLTYDWTRRKLAAAGVDGYPIEQGYHINTLQYLRRGRVNYVDFENPMAYYDLAGDHDGRPELFIRMAYFGQGRPIEEVTYSWNQYNTEDLHWHFKLGLLGQYLVQSQTTIGDFILQTVPYDELPGWVTERPWDLATFVADEGGAYDSSEGIYEWAPLEGVIPDASTTRVPLPGAEQAVAGFVLGRTAASPAPFFDAIRTAFRAEYREAGGPVTLYYSPIDRRLHLLKALKGVWNQGGGRELRYAPVGGDYLGYWSLRESGREVQGLWQVSDQLVLADESGVRLRHSDLPPALFLTAPPTDHESWERLGEQLGPQDSPDAAAGAVPREMFDRVPGPELDIAGATAHDLRATPDGFRVVLGLPGGAQSSDAPFAQGLPAGEYVATYSPATGYRLEPLTASGLTVGIQVEPQSDATTPGRFDVRQPLNVRVRLLNAGQADAPAARLELLAAPDGQSERVLGTATLDAVAGSSSVASFVWVPPDAGGWTLRARVSATATGDAEAVLPWSVQAAGAPSARALLTPQAPAVLGLLVLFAVMGATASAITLSALHRPGRRGGGP